MFKKSALTLAATIIATLATQSSGFASDARSNVRDHRTPANVTVRDHRTQTKTTVRDHRTIRKNEVVVIDRKDCRLGYDKLESRGFVNIVMRDCTGAKYSYFAKRNSNFYNAYMHAYSGSIQIHRLGIIFNN